MLEIISQIAGYVAAALIIISFQIKRLKVFYLMQILGNAMFVVSFLLVGKYAGAMLNFAGGVRTVLFMFEKLRARKSVTWMIAGFMAALGVVSGFLGDGWVAIFACVAQVSGTFFLATGKNKPIRISQLALVSPMWMAYNIVSSVIASGHIVWGGIICESFNIVSAAIFLLRMAITENKEKKVESNGNQ